jgi:tetratricopeptide (TPR) repeat protein
MSDGGGNGGGGGNAAGGGGASHDLFNRAFALHQAKDASGASRLYEEVLEIDPKHAHAYHGLGVIAYSAGRRSDAIQLFRQAIALNGTEAVFHHNLAHALRDEGDAAGALECLSTAVTLNPEFMGGWLALAQLLESLGRKDEAARALERLAQLQTKTAEAHHRRGIEYVRASRLQEAYEEFRAGITCNPRGAGLYYNAGNVLNALGRHAEAIACLTQAANLEPKSAQIYASLSNAHYRAGDLDRALRARAQAWSLDQTIAESRFEVSASPIVKRPDGAARPGTALTPAQAIAKAVERHQSGDLAMAEELYKKIIAVDAQNADAVHLLGVLRHQRGDQRGALELVDRVVAAGRASAHVFSNRALILAALGELEAAEASCRRALELDPQHAAARDNLALVRNRRTGPEPDAPART